MRRFKLSHVTDIGGLLLKMFSTWGFCFSRTGAQKVQTALVLPGFDGFERCGRSPVSLGSANTFESFKWIAIEKTNEVNSIGLKSEFGLEIRH
jgi:hypothetical protein